MTPRKTSKVVCECLGVTEAEITAAIRAEELSTVKQVTACTDAGGGCTACHPAIRAMLERECRARAQAQAAEAAPPAPAYLSSLPTFSER